MQRILNDPDQIVDEMLNGFVKAHPDIVSRTDNPRVLKSVFMDGPGRVGVVTGGGSGHKPAFIGYLGKNMCDAVAVGEICTSPTASAFLDAFRAANRGRGVACLYGNYSGDNMNVQMAIKMAKKEGIEVKTVVANDDAASAPRDQREKRRGVAGEVLMWKVGGAMAASSASLDEVIAVAQKAIDNTRSVGIGLTPCTLPAVGHPNFAIEPGTMEVGIGHHGEPGIAVQPLETAAGMARRMADIVLDDLPFGRDDRVAVLVSGLGATPVMELYVLFDEIDKILAERGIAIYRSYVGNYFTSLDMMGATLTVMKMDPELERLLDLEAYSVALRQAGPQAAPQGAPQRPPQPERSTETQATPQTKPQPEMTTGPQTKPQPELTFAPKTMQQPELTATPQPELTAGPQSGLQRPDAFDNKQGKPILARMVAAIQANKAYLGEIDGLIGDGDHGMNMSKGFTLFADRFLGQTVDFTEGLDLLAQVLLNEIGGSMGPIYGTLFMAMAKAGSDAEEIDLKRLHRMLAAGQKALFGLIDARVGDKTLIDTLAPSIDALEQAIGEGKSFADALTDLKAAAKAGMESTKGLVANYGRSSRLGERSRGVLDAGAVSCCLILQAMANGILDLLK